jgi:arylsulfatase A-like enzyme
MRSTRLTALLPRLYRAASGFGIMLFAPGALAAPASGANRPPNIVVILADDLGYGDVGFNGCDDIPTPQIDSIRRDGVRFTSGYVTYPACGPSRAGLLTGRYQGRFGFRTNPTIDPGNPAAGIPHDETNLAEALTPAGYHCGVIGKWHLGSHPSQRPLARGFAEFFGFLSGGHDYFPHLLTLDDLSQVSRKWEWYRTKILRNDTRIEIDDYLTDEFSDEAVAFVSRNAGRPFFLYLAYNAPHAPLQAPEKYLARFAGIPDRKRRTYAAMVSGMDDGIGRLLDQSRRSGIEQDTLVFFLSDNGGPEADNGSDNGPLRGRKGLLYEGGVRVPFVAKWPGVLPAGIDFDPPVLSLDIFATATALAGVDSAEERPLDGVNLIPYLTGAVSSPPHAAIFWNEVRTSAEAMRVGDLKLIRPTGGTVECYDLEADLGEARDQAASRAEQIEGSFQDYDRWRGELQPAAFPGLDQDEWWK